MKLGDQWIEIIDGQEHMVKAVGKCGKCTGCIYLFQQDRCHAVCKHDSAWTDSECPFKVIDLGILKDGKLQCPFCGEYPRIGVFGDGFEPIKFYVTHDNNKCNMWSSMRTRSFDSEQQAIDAWNRRA